MLLVNWDKRIIKPLMRKYVAKGSRPGKKRALVFPASHGFCVEELLRKGVLTPDTKTVAVEREPEVMAQFRESSKRFGFRSLTLHKGEVEELTLTGVYDFWHFDYCGFLPDRTIEWTKANADALVSPETEGFITLMESNRLSPAKAPIFHRMVREAKNDPSFEENVKLILETGKLHKVEKTSDEIITKGLSRKFAEVIASHIYITRKLFAAWDFDVGFVAYADRDAGEWVSPNDPEKHCVPMFLLHLSSFRSK